MIQCHCEAHKLPSVIWLVTRDMIRVSHSRLVTRELGQPIRNPFISLKSRLAGSPLAIIPDLGGPKSRVTSDESLLATSDSWLMTT